MANRIAKKIGEITSAIGEIQRAKKNIRALKPQIAAKQQKVRQIRLNRGLSQPKSWGGSSKYLG